MAARAVAARSAGRVGSQPRSSGTEISRPRSANAEDSRYTEIDEIGLLQSSRYGRAGSTVPDDVRVADLTATLSSQTFQSSGPPKSSLVRSTGRTGSTELAALPHAWQRSREVVEKTVDVPVEYVEVPRYVEVGRPRARSCPMSVSPPLRRSVVSWVGLLRTRCPGT